MLRMRAFSFIFAAFLMQSCQEDEFELEDLNGTWDIKWRRCEVYHSDKSGNITFVVNDSIQDQGTITEYINDSLVSIDFRFQWVDNTYLIIDSLSNTSINPNWLGTHQISELSTTRFILTRDKQSCAQEQYKFGK